MTTLAVVKRAVTANVGPNGIAPEAFLDSCLLGLWGTPISNVEIHSM